MTCPDFSQGPGCRWGGQPGTWASAGTPEAPRPLRLQLWPETGYTGQDAHGPGGDEPSAGGGAVAGHGGPITPPPTGDHQCHEDPVRLRHHLHRPLIHPSSLNPHAEPREADRRGVSPKPRMGNSRPGGQRLTDSSRATWQAGRHARPHPHSTCWAWARGRPVLAWRLQALLQPSSPSSEMKGWPPCPPRPDPGALSLPRMHWMVPGAQLQTLKPRDVGTTTVLSVTLLCPPGTQFPSRCGAAATPISGSLRARPECWHDVNGDI